MAEQAIIMTPNDFDRLSIQIRDDVKKEISALKTLVVEKPMTTKEAAKFLSIHEDTLYIRLKKGLPHHRDGKIIWFFPSELVTYIKTKNKQ